MTKPITDLDELINLSINWTGENEELDCDITLIEDGQAYKAYTVSVCYKDLLFYTDKACISYDVNSYGDKNSIVCNEIIED